MFKQALNQDYIRYSPDLNPRETLKKCVSIEYFLEKLALKVKSYRSLVYDLCVMLEYKMFINTVHCV